MFVNPTNAIFFMCGAKIKSLCEIFFPETDTIFLVINEARIYILANITKFSVFINGLVELL